MTEGQGIACFSMGDQLIFVGEHHVNLSAVAQSTALELVKLYLLLPELSDLNLRADLETVINAYWNGIDKMESENKSRCLYIFATEFGRRKLNKESLNQSERDLTTARLNNALKEIKQ